MTRKAYIERVRRSIYNGQPSDDATITTGLVNNLLEDAIGFAAKQNYIESGKLDGIRYVNNSFYTSFNDISVDNYSQFRYRVTLPQIPFGIGQDEGVPMLQFNDTDSAQISQTVIWLTQNQKTFFSSMRPIPNKILAYSEGKYVYVLSTLLLSQYTANVTMISGGDPRDLSSELNVPGDYIGLMTDFLVKYFTTELNQPKDVTNDGEDFRVTT